MNEYFEKNHKWQKRGISINPKFIQNYVIFPMLIIVLVIMFGAMSCYIGKGIIEVRNDHIIKIKIAEQKKIDRERAIEAQKQKEEHEEQIKTQEKKREKKINCELEYNKNIALWNQIKDEYKMGSYVENVITHKRGQVVGYQGERVFVAVKDKNNNVIQEWWFDYGIDAIEMVGFKDYAKYRNYIMLIQK